MYLDTVNTPIIDNDVFQIAAAASDGKVTIVEYRNDTWVPMSFVNDSLGNSLY